MKRMLLTAALTLGVATVASAQVVDILSGETVIGHAQSLGVDLEGYYTFEVTNTSSQSLNSKIPCRSLHVSPTKTVRAMWSHGSILSDNLWGYRVSSQ